MSNNPIRSIVIIAIVIFLAYTFAPLIIFVLAAGFLYTVYTRYQESKNTVNVSKQEDLSQYEERKSDLEILEAEYEEKSR
ncbi:MAG: hypothetical protein E7191_05645 [Erysipelotrichaceae bacterium]|nr:hypothetical protein [Erysipelotrichaceae bacterium]MBQ9987345.1 hypothetical protein [Erysipelotrichales bacterium]